MGTNDVMLTEFSCSATAILDLSTGSCLPLTCDASCAADGLYWLFGSDRIPRNANSQFKFTIAIRLPAT